MGEQSLQKHGARLYDAMEITTSDGTRKTVYFDISEFYGKL
jgi:VCBS repeat-containing protein